MAITFKKDIFLIVNLNDTGSQQLMYAVVSMPTSIRCSGCYEGLLGDHNGSPDDDLRPNRAVVAYNSEGITAEEIDIFGQSCKATPN